VSRFGGGAIGLGGQGGGCWLGRIFRCVQQRDVEWGGGCDGGVDGFSFASGDVGVSCFAEAMRFLMIWGCGGPTRG